MRVERGAALWTAMVRSDLTIGTPGRAVSTPWRLAVCAPWTRRLILIFMPDLPGVVRPVRYTLSACLRVAACRRR